MRNNVHVRRGRASEPSGESPVGGGEIELAIRAVEACRSDGAVFGESKAPGIVGERRAGGKSRRTGALHSDRGIASLAAAIGVVAVLKRVVEDGAFIARGIRDGVDETRRAGVAGGGGKAGRASIGE